MEEITEIKDTLRDIAELQQQHEKWLEEVENRKIDLPDYSAAFGRIDEKLDSILMVGNDSDLKESIRKQATASSNLVTVITRQREMQESLIREIPSTIKFRIEHRFTGQQRHYIITGVVFVLISAFSLVASIYLWKRNSELHSHNIRYRAARLMYPEAALSIDSAYRNSPGKMQDWVKREEERLIAIARAEEAERKTKEKAKRAGEEVRRLKRLKK